MAAGTPKYFSFPFGVNGDLLDIPDPTQPSGVVSYQIGFGPDYQLVDTDPSSLTIPRNQFNQLMFDITSTLQQLYQNGFPLFITTAMNDGSAYSYSKNAYVFQPADGNVYYSLVNSNTDVPPSSKWQLFNNSFYLNFAVDTGIASHYVVAPSPAATSLFNGLVCQLNPTLANTGACDINVNGLGIKSIKTLANADPAANQLIPTGYYTLIYNGTNWVVQNPSPASGSSSVFATVNIQTFSSSGTYIPSSGMVYCIVEEVAAGGGGGGGSGTAGTGAGGGAGEYRRASFSAATIGGSQTVTIGAPGAGGTAGSTGTTGGNTSLGSLLVANGGVGGGGITGSVGTNYSVNGGPGGTGGSGGFGIPGGAGQVGNHTVGVQSFGGAGANSQFGVGGMAVLAPLPNTNGNNATGYGAGGGGCANDSAYSGSLSGGNATSGFMIITEYCSQ